MSEQTKITWLVIAIITLAVGLSVLTALGDSEGTGSFLIVMCLGISGLLSEEVLDV